MVLDIAMELAEFVKTLSRAPEIPSELAASGHDEVPMNFDFVRVDNAIDELTRITRYLNVTGKAVALSSEKCNGGFQWIRL